MLKVGAFTYEAGKVSGPSEYMNEQGSAKLEEIQSGKSAVFNFGCTRCKGTEVELARLVLVTLQTDYAGWRGMKTLGR